MLTLLFIFLATLLVSLISFIGLFVFGKKTDIKKMMEAMISLAAAILLGNVFIELLPELVKLSQAENATGDFHRASLWILASIVFFILIEKYFHWHHCNYHHSHEDHVHPMGYNVLVGDGIHNFIDGIAIAISFMISTNTGIITTLAIMLHEIPQEIGDYSLLIHAGFTRVKALLFNFASGLLSVLGGVLTYFYIQTSSHQLALTAAAVASFLYISLSDIIPELHQKNSKHYFQQLIWFIIGLLIVFLANNYLHE